MKRILIILSVLALSISLYSQNYQNYLASSYYYIDGIRNSQNFYGSSARSASMGGAFTSLGGDLGGISVNPAGIGVFRSSEFSFSPAYNSISTSSNYIGTKTNDIKYNFNLGNIGAVFTFNNNNSEGWVSTNFAVGYNKLNNFNYNYSIESPNSNSSMTNEFLSYSYNQDGSAKSPENLDSYWERLAFDAYVIDTANGGKYYTPISNNIKQEHQISMSGSMSEIYFGFGANYNHQLYIGATLNIRTGSYDEVYDHTETDLDATSSMNYYHFTHTISTLSRGFNLKIGAIYRPIDLLRVGLSLETPTVMHVDQTSNSKIYSLFRNGNEYRYSPMDVSGNLLSGYNELYNITSPFRANAGIALILQEYGLISFDYEYIDFRSIKLNNSSNNSDFTVDNDAISKGLTATNNIRLGAEYRMGSVFFRGGYAYYASPYASTEYNKDASSKIYSGGIGYRNNNFLLDFSYSLLTRNEKYFMYVGSSSANISNSTGNFMATLGFKF